MTRHDRKQNDAAVLRQQAEEQLRQQPAGASARGPGEGEGLLHELHVHQIELEMQNEELRRAQAGLEASRARYFDLYDQAPVGYLTLSGQGLILEANLTAATLLGLSKRDLVNKALTRFILKEDQDVFYLHREKLLATGSPQVCDLRMRKKGSATVWVHIEDSVARGSDGALVCRAVLSDISERMRMEESLRESEARLRLIADNMLDMVSQVTLDGTRIYVSPAHERVLGYKPEAMVGTSVLEFVHPDDVERVTAAVQTALQTLSPERVEFRSRHADGNYLWLETIGRALFDDNGSPTGGVLSSRDITERKHAEEALHESEERYRRLVETLPDGVIIHSQGRVVFANAASATIIGAASPAELTGKAVMEFVHPDYRELALKRIQQSLREGMPASGAEEKFVRLDGTPVDVQVTAVPFSYAGKPAMLTVFEDITERKRMENALFEERNLLRMLMDNLPDAIYFKDSQGRFIRMGQAHARAFGLSDPAQAIGKTDFDFFTEDHARRALADEQAIMRSSQPLIDVEERDTHLDGRVVWVSTTKMPLRNQDGRIVGTFGISHDITERKQAEERIKRQLEHLSALHDIDLAIAGSTDVRIILATLLKHVITELHVDAATILLLDANTQMLEFAVGRGFDTTALQHTHLRLGSGYAGQAVLEGRIIQAPNLIEAPDGLRQSPALAAEGFVFYCAAPLKSKGHAVGVLEVFRRSPLKADQEWLEFLEALGTQAALAVDNAQLFDRLQRSNLELSFAYDATIEGWSRALDLRDRQTEGHTQRCAEMSVRLASAMGVEDAALAHIRRGALLHDIGKIGMPDSILLKPGQLSDDEWTIMRQHPQLAYDMLLPIAYLRQALDIPYCHHERWDGSGYPQGLKGEQIPLAARVFAVADVFEALTSDRPFRVAWLREKARQYVREQAGKHFDPRVVEMWLRMLKGE